MLAATRNMGLGSSLRQAAFTTARNPASRTAASRMVLKRAVQTESHPPSKGLEMLNHQRLKRPSSPHFTIYQPQLTWLGSIANRATGGALSAPYLFAPGTFDSAHVIEFVHNLPEGVKYAGKALLSAPFAFHSFNGVRHLLWDSGKFLTVKGAYQTGYAVLGATGLTTVYLTLFQ
ncbi:cytochrome b subunit of succinate dehydrogenase, Sdh3p [Marasmius sp. AFHP31]|nr:cytochrome b subunit of succinate dehydrogenase, Sdh3p [Marasmius sp. AFHP31]